MLTESLKERLIRNGVSSKTILRQREAFRVLEEAARVEFQRLAHENCVRHARRLRELDNEVLRLMGLQSIADDALEFLLEFEVIAVAATNDCIANAMRKGD